MPDATETRTATRERIVAVAARLLDEHGPAAVTTRAVAEGAAVQAPTIYRLFGDKDGLLEAVAEHVMARHVEAKTETERAAVARDGDPVDDLRHSWLAQIDFGLANPAVFRLLSEPSRVLSSPAAQAGQRVLGSRVHRVAATGRLRVGEQRAVDLVQAAGVGVITTLLTTPARQRDPDLPEAMLQTVLAQVLTDAPGSGGEGGEGGDDDRTVTAAVTLRAAVAGLDVLTEGERRLLGEWLDRVVAAS